MRARRWILGRSWRIHAVLWRQSAQSAGTVRCRGRRTRQSRISGRNRSDRRQRYKIGCLGVRMVWSDALPANGLGHDPEKWDRFSEKIMPKQKVERRG